MNKKSNKTLNNFLYLPNKNINKKDLNFQICNFQFLYFISRFCKLNVCQTDLCINIEKKNLLAIK